MIDNCANTFAELANEILPKRMEELRHAMQSPRPLAHVAERGVGLKTILKEMGKTEDFSACYVLMADVPFYVGISGGLVQRLLDHVGGSNHWTASLAHMMATKNSGYTGTRNKALEDRAYACAFKQAKSDLAKGSFAFIEIQNPLELYLFEVYAAMELDTSEWNSFFTH